jgi:hypothetical protein
MSVQSAAHKLYRCGTADYSAYPSCNVNYFPRAVAKNSFVLRGVGKLYLHSVNSFIFRWAYMCLDTYKLYTREIWYTCVTSLEWTYVSGVCTVS